MGINNSGLPIRSGKENANVGNLNTQAILPKEINSQIATTNPGVSLQATVLNSVTNIVVDKQFVENAKKAPISNFSLSGNTPATTLNPSVKTIKKQKPEKQKLFEKLYFKPDVLSLPTNTYTNNRFKSTNLKGFASQRPEIISLSDFKSIFENQKILKYNNLGYFFDYKFQLVKLREKTIENLKNLLSTNEITRNEYNRLTKDFSDFIKKQEEKLKLIESFITIFRSFDKAFQIREIDESFFKLNNLLTIEEFFIQKMNYSKISYNSFSDTKILYQMLFDLRAASENYSLNLLRLTDSDRVNDTNSVKIDTTYTKTNNFNFDINNLSTKLRGGSPKLGLNEDNFFNFLNSLPSNLSERIKITLHTFGRILRISKGLNKPNVKSAIDTKFSSFTDFNPFDNIIGIIPNDIFTQPIGVGTIASTLLFQDTNNSNIKVLPFENTIVDDGETKYVPGNVYFKDNTIENMDTFSMLTFGEDLVTKISNTTSVYNEIFNFNDIGFNLIPQNIIKTVFDTIKNTISYCINSTGSSSFESLIIPALINLSNTDKLLKLYLFQFVLLLGMIRANKESNFELYKKLKKELKTLKSFPSIDSELELTNDIDQSSTLKNVAITLANLITEYVTKILTENSILQLNSDASFNPPPRNDGFSSVFLQTNSLISKVLTDAVSATNSNKPNLFKDFLDISSIFYTSAVPFFSNDETTTSSYLNISLSNILLLLFESISSISGKFLPIKFDIDNGKIFGILYHQKHLKASQKAIEKLLTGLPKNLNVFQTEITIPLTQGASSTNEQYALPIDILYLSADEEYLRKFDYFYTEYKDIYDSIQGEDFFLRNIIAIFESLSFNFNQVKRYTENIFSRLSEDQKQVINQNSNLLNPAQFLISKKLLLKLKEESTLGNLLQDNEYYHLSSFILSEAPKKENLSQKILNIGIPNGFIDNVKERLDKLSVTSGQQQVVDFKNENNLIAINVFRKSLLDEEIIFKPQKYLFDLNLSVAPYEKDIEIDPLDSFENNSKFIKFIDENLISVTPKSKQEILSNEKYRFLLNNQKEEIFHNTIKSFLLNKYNILSTGLDLSELAFSLTDYNFSVSEEYNSFLRLYLQTQNIAYTTYENLISDQTIDQSIKDNANLIKKSFYELNKQTTESILFTPKTFDKIFNIVINLDLFEIDTELTNPSVLQNDQIKNRLYKKNDKLYINSFNNTEMNEFYVAVEILG